MTNIILPDGDRGCPIAVLDTDYHATIEADSVHSSLPLIGPIDKCSDRQSTIADDVSEYRRAMDQWVHDHQTMGSKTYGCEIEELKP